jgi:Protein of unknown function (DUF3016)
MDSSLQSRRSLRSLVAAATLLCAAALPPAHATGSVEVQWLEPALYSDAGRSGFDRDRTLQVLGEHLQKLSRLLPDGQVLKLQVTDLDLAGEIEPFHWRDLRVLRSRADWPRMSLRYTLSAEGRTLKSGEAQVQDMGYAFSRQAEDLGYEKRMLEQWLRAEFSGLR